MANSAKHLCLSAGIEPEGASRRVRVPITELQSRGAVLTGDQSLSVRSFKLYLAQAHAICQMSF